MGSRQSKAARRAQSFFGSVNKHLAEEVTDMVRKQYTKLAVAAISILLATAMVVTVSYAWLTISDNPVLTGIQVTIGGGETILLAPDVTQELEDGTLVHYPGTFSNQLNFNQQAGYEYLQSVLGLSPVSTVDGITWVLPTFYDFNDEEVKNGSAQVGDIKPHSQFQVETNLEHANLSAGDEDSAKGGHYIYLDFWVVSPSENYNLHLSQGDSDGGSYLVELPRVVDNGMGSYELEASTQAAAASARIGFWINRAVADDASMVSYVQSIYDNDSYNKLLGNYPEKSETVFADSTSDRFVIYEPNGMLHPEVGTDGEYLTTWPLGVVENEIYQLNIPSGCLAVQVRNEMLVDANGTYTLNTALQTALYGKSVETSERAEQILYRQYLQGQLAQYVNRGQFVGDMSTLEAYATSGAGVVSADKLENGLLSAASDDVVLTRLERNVPQRIRMYIWLEGQDADCTNSAAGALLALNIQLSGSSD